MKLQKMTKLKKIFLATASLMGFFLLLYIGPNVYMNMSAKKSYANASELRAKFIEGMSQTEVVRYLSEDRNWRTLYCHSAAIKPNKEEITGIISRRGEKLYIRKSGLYIDTNGPLDVILKNPEVAYLGFCSKITVSFQAYMNPIKINFDINFGTDRNVLSITSPKG